MTYAAPSSPVERLYKALLSWEKIDGYAPDLCAIETVLVKTRQLIDARNAVLGACQNVFEAKDIPKVMQLINEGKVNAHSMQRPWEHGRLKSENLLGRAANFIGLYRLFPNLAQDIHESAMVAAKTELTPDLAVATSAQGEFQTAVGRDWQLAQDFNTACSINNKTGFTKVLGIFNGLAAPKFSNLWHDMFRSSPTLNNAPDTDTLDGKQAANAVAKFKQTLTALIAESVADIAPDSFEKIDVNRRKQMIALADKIGMPDLAKTMSRGMDLSASSTDTRSPAFAAAAPREFVPSR